MIVKPDCPVKLTSFQARRILTQLKVGNYFQTLKGGAETLPPFSGFVNEFENIAKQFFIKTDYNFDNFVNDPHNAGVIKEVLDTLFENTSEKNIDHLALLKSTHDIKQDAISTGEINADKEVQQSENKADEATIGFIDENALTNDLIPSEFRAVEFENSSEFYKAMFHNTNYLESKFKTFFTKEIIIRSLIIDPKTRTVISAEGDTGEALINSNLKARRREILERLLDRHQVNKIEVFTDPVSGQSLQRNILITPELATTTPKLFNYLLQELENRITKPSYKGGEVDLLDGTVNTLYSIARDADNDFDQEAIDIVDDYMDYVALRRFDEILKQTFNEYVYVNDKIEIDPFNDDPKYKFIVKRAEEAHNSNYSNEIKGLETVSDLYNVIVTSTPILNINTGQETKNYLSKASIQRAISPYFDRIDPRNGVRSIKNLIIEGMFDNSSLWENRNILYTLYKNFFEEYGDEHGGNTYSASNQVETDAKVSDKYPESYLQTIMFNNLQREHPIMLLITEPAKTIAKIAYLEATVNTATDSVKVSELSEGKSSTRTSVESMLFNYLNTSENVIANIAKWKPKGGTTLDSTLTITYNEEEYVIKGSDVYIGQAKTELPQDLVTELSYDLLGIDFNNITVDRDFKQELTSRERDNVDSSFPTYYVQFLRQALQATVAKNEILTNNDLRDAIDKKQPQLEIKSGNSLVNSLFGEGSKRVPLDKLDDYKVKFNKMDTLQPVLDAYTASKDRVTGNTAKSVITNKEGNAIGAYSKYNLFTALKRNLNDASKIHNSILNHDPTANVFSHNALIQDPNLLKGLVYRDAIEVNDRVVPNTKQTALTTYNFNINGAYFSSLAQAKQNGVTQVIIDPTVYSDKGKNAMGVFGNNFTFDGANYKLFIGDNGKVVDEGQSVELLYRTNGQYYKKYSENIITDWMKVIAAAGGELTLPSSGSANRLKAINEFNSGDFWYSNKAHPFLRGRDAALYYASRVGVSLNNFVHYQSYGKTFSNSHAKTPLIIKDTLINEVALYDHPDSSKLKKKLDEKLISDVNMVNRSGFRFTGDAAAFIDKQYPNIPSFKKTIDKKVVFDITSTGIKPVTDINQINPAYRKYFYDWNFLSENLLNIALGNIHAHKGKDANAIWTAMTKRNVMAGATIRPFALGLEKGVEEFTRTAFVDDIITPITTIHGDTEGIVDLDGGSFVTMTQRLKSYESLNQQYQGNGGPEQKPFISMMDFLKGQNGMTKFADFVLDRETIRNSIGSDIDFMKLHKDQLYNYPISHLDITKSWKDGVDLNNLDMYVYRRDFDYATGQAGKIEKLERIEHVSGNMYKILKSDPSKLNSAYSESVVLNTWFDLWQTLGDIDTVSPSKNTTSIYYTSDQGTKVYFDESDSSSMKLLDYEAYVGDKTHQSIKPNYIPATGEPEVDGVYELYKTLTDEYDVVLPKLELMVNVALNEPVTQEEFQALGMHNVIPFEDFIRIVNENADIIPEFFDHVYNQTQDKEVAQYMTTWQPVKGKLIDRVTTAGAQKFGQMNINRSSTFSEKAKQDFTKESEPVMSENIAIPTFDKAFIKKMIDDGELLKDCN